MRSSICYSALPSRWPVEELAGPADVPAGCGEVARGGVFTCLELHYD